MAIHHRSGTCPLCGFHVPAPLNFEGLWHGVKPGGDPAGGGVYRARCRLCRAMLVAFSDVYDDTGRVVPTPKRRGESDLKWSLLGVSLQTIALLALVVSLSAWYLLPAG